MRWPTLAAATLVAVALNGCDRIPGLGGGEEETPPPDTATAAAAETETPETQDPVQQPEPQPTPEATQPETTPAVRPPVQRPMVTGTEVPWTPTHTGTVNPGMTRDEVVAVWGEPVTERSAGEWTYLYFRNGCEVACGTYDVVLFRENQVEDAIVRGPGHVYSGESSSPPNALAQFTPPGG